MKRRNVRVALCTLSVIGFSVMAGGTAMADGDSDRIAIPYLQENAWDELAMANDDAVSTGVNIRATADENGEIIGYLYQGGAAWVLNKGKEWTEVCSGDLTGFIKNDYLLYGRDVIGLADHYGLEGVATTWNDVNLYAEADGSSEVLKTLESGEYFPLVADGGHWLTVQYGADSMARVSEEDVARVLILDTAVPKDGVYEGHASVAESYEEPAYTETEPTYTEPTYTETEPTYTEPTYTETEPVYTETEAPQTEAPQTEAPQTEAPQTEADVDDGSTDTEDTSSDSGVESSDDGYYDADTDTYYDGNGNVVQNSYNSDVSYEEPDYTETEPTYTEPTYTEPDYTETEPVYTETEAPQTEASQGSSDDASLLAALIYCEAGNQSYEGMVAVGAVVMNRVNSASFPGTISDVIYQGGQFTPASSGSLASALANGVPSTCYDAAVAAMNGENPVGGALYFNTGSGKGTKIGDHQFY